MGRKWRNQCRPPWGPKPAPDLTPAEIDALATATASKVVNKTSVIWLKRRAMGEVIRWVEETP